MPPCGRRPRSKRPQAKIRWWYWVIPLTPWSRQATGHRGRSRGVDRHGVAHVVRRRGELRATEPAVRCAAVGVSSRDRRCLSRCRPTDDRPQRRQRNGSVHLALLRNTAAGIAALYPAHRRALLRASRQRLVCRLRSAMSACRSRSWCRRGRMPACRRAAGSGSRDCLRDHLIFCGRAGRMELGRGHMHQSPIPPPVLTDDGRMLIVSGAMALLGHKPESAAPIKEAGHAASSDARPIRSGWKSDGCCNRA
jgi:hypothetical protein